MVLGLVPIGLFISHLWFAMSRSGVLACPARINLTSACRNSETSSAAEISHELGRGEVLA